MFQKNNTVEDGRVRAHETAEAASGKVHEMIDKVAEQTELGGERAKEFRDAAAAQAATARESAADRAADLREQAEDAKKQAGKDTKKRKKAAAKQVKKSKKKAGKQVEQSKKKATKDVRDMRDTLVDDVVPKVVDSATGLATAGVAAGRKAADEASARAPEVIAALRDQRDPQAALAAAKGEKVKKKGRKRTLLFIALVVGGVAAFIAKQKQGQKKDPWAVPAGDPYKAPTSGRETSVPAAAPVAEKADSAAPAGSDPLAAPTSIDADPLADPAAPITDTPDAREEGENAEEGTDAWSSARDWADNSAVPATSETSEGSDLHTDHLGGDLSVDGDDKA